MKQAIGWLLLLIVMTAFFLWASPVSAQGLLVKQGKDPVGVITPNQNNPSEFEINMRGLSQKTAVNLVIDHCIVAKCTDVQTIGNYNVVYKDKVYTVDLIPGVEPREGYPMTFTSIGDVRKQLKLVIKYDLGIGGT